MHLLCRIAVAGEETMIDGVDNFLKVLMLMLILTVACAFRGLIESNWLRPCW